jgi:hypothetical protein
MIIVPNIYADENATFERVFRSNSLDLDAKSLKGWIRLFNSNEKLRDYDIYITDTERIEIIYVLKKKYMKEKETYERGIE